MKYTPFLLLLFFLAAIISCKKDKLTKETQNGANTFSCLIDGAIYKPCSEPPVIGSSNVPSLYGGLSISGNKTWASVGASCYESHVDKNITLTIDNLTGVGEYDLPDGTNEISYSTYDGIKSRQYSSYSTGNGKITITKDDRANTILSGTFEFEGADNNDPGKIIKISSGRFDIKY
ncbi:MAG: DUF6252 family protein [Agriterribacter sp.]